MAIDLFSCYDRLHEHNVTMSHRYCKKCLVFSSHMSWVIILVGFFNEKLTVHAYLENMYDVYFPTNLISCYFCINNCNTNKHIFVFHLQLGSRMRNFDVFHS